MELAKKPAIASKYVSEEIKLDFSNTENLKTDIQNRVYQNTDARFITALQNVKGDDKSGVGVSFSEITLLAMAFFIDKVLIDKIKDEHYTLENIKGLLDAKNLTPYTAIHEIDVEYFKLVDHTYFKHCWLIIQTAWFLNSPYFGSHQHLEYLDHFSKTGIKLPLNEYLYDKSYLEKKYSDIAQNKLKSISQNGYNIVTQWYHTILFLICNELDLPVTNFKVTVKDNREYNPLTKTSRQLRSLMPFKINECDIKSAFPTFLDFETGSNIKDVIYPTLMSLHGISREQAKVLYNRMLNSGAYHSKDETSAFLQECGYSASQIDHILTLTHDRNQTFFSFMTEYENLAIVKLTEMNALQRSTRLHDSVIFIDDKTDIKLLEIESKCHFGKKALNQPVIKNTFALSSKKLPYAYIGSIPQSLKLVTSHHGTLPELKG